VNGRDGLLDNGRNERLDRLFADNLQHNDDRNDRLTKMPAERTIAVVVGRMGRTRRFGGSFWRPRIVVMRAPAVVMMVAALFDSGGRFAVRMAQRANDAIDRLQSDGKGDEENVEATHGGASTAQGCRACSLWQHCSRLSNAMKLHERSHAAAISHCWAARRLI